MLYFIIQSKLAQILSFILWFVVKKAIIFLVFSHLLNIGSEKKYEFILRFKCPIQKRPERPK